MFTMPGGGWLEDADNGGNSDEGVEEGKTDRIMLDTGLNREGGGVDGAVAAAGAGGGVAHDGFEGQVFKVSLYSIF